MIMEARCAGRGGFFCNTQSRLGAVSHVQYPNFSDMTFENIVASYTSRPTPERWPHRKWPKIMQRVFSSTTLRFHQAFNQIETVERREN